MASSVPQTLFTGAGAFLLSLCTRPQIEDQFLRGANRGTDVVQPDTDWEDQAIVFDSGRRTAFLETYRPPLKATWQCSRRVVHWPQRPCGK
jgi:hypothetical protein